MINLLVSFPKFKITVDSFNYIIAIITIWIDFSMIN